MTSSIVVKTSRPPHGQSTFRRAGYRVAEVLALATVFLLVAALGLGATAGKDPAAKPYTDTEHAQLDAVRRASTLAAQARELAAVVPEPELASLIVRTAGMLEQQAGALALPAPVASAAAGTGSRTGDGSASSTADGTGSPADGTGDGSASSTADGTGGVPADDGAGPARSLTPGAAVDVREPLSIESFTASLAHSAQTGLEDAAETEPGPARLLATASAGQWQYAVELSSRAGVSSGLPAFYQPTGAAQSAADADPPQNDCIGGRPDAAAITGPAAASADRAATATRTPATPNTHTRAPATPATDATDLVSAALRAERGADYAYEVAAARLPDPAAALDLSSRHADAARSAAVLLAQLCGTVPPAPPAFHLDAALLADPASGIAALEEELSEMYGDLVGLSEGSTRAWAIAQLNTAVQRSHAADGLAEPFPGLTIDPIPDGKGLPQDGPTALPLNQPTTLPEDTP